MLSTAQMQIYSYHQNNERVFVHKHRETSENSFGRTHTQTSALVTAAGSFPHPRRISKGFHSEIGLSSSSKTQEVPKKPDSRNEESDPELHPLEVYLRGDTVRDQLQVCSFSDGKHGAAGRRSNSGCLWLALWDPGVLWEGLWMSCLSQWGRLQCKVYDSGLALSPSAQISRGLCVLSLLLCFLALPLCVSGLKCTRCLGDAQQFKARLARFGAALFLLAAFCFLSPVCWTAYDVIRDFYDPNVAAPLKRELGPALYLGWIVAVLMLVGGALLFLGSASPAIRATPALGKGGKVKTPATVESKPEKVFV
ncbi:hypothetical protein DNTS_017216 [Danionella cerebrum]|uniref:Uncharacterized protein n=1 Tax=Danionella cerebrum TaxID=2873325 RepID=A0A553QBN9_9TELE|nr:hypothetical protein DNTS_017216 [Danionella translucida]